MSKNQALAEDIQKAAGSITAKLADAQRDIQSLQALMNNNEELLRQKLMQAQREQAEQERLRAAREQELLKKEAEQAQAESDKEAQAAQTEENAHGQSQKSAASPEAAVEKKAEENVQAQDAQPGLSAKASSPKEALTAEHAQTAEMQNGADEVVDAAGAWENREPLNADKAPEEPAQASPVTGEAQNEQAARQVAAPQSEKERRFDAEKAVRPQSTGKRPQAPANAQGRPNMQQRPFQTQPGGRPQAQGQSQPRQGFNRSQSFDGRGAQGAQQSRTIGERSQSERSGNRQGGRAQAQGGRPQSRPQGGLKIPAFDASLPTEKGRVSNYDPNKKQYSREHEEKRLNKREGAPRQRGAVFEEDERIRSRKPKRKESAQQKMEPIKIEHAVMTTELISIKDLSEKLGKPATAIIKKLFLLGIMATINNEIDYDTAALVATDFGIDLEQKIAKTFEETLTDAAVQDGEEDTFERPPVVTIMGHVDHGKTSLLDAIRSTNVTAHEAGGITQHIGAYTVSHNGRTITFLDTPGHEAFTSMRARGAQVTDIAILVVAADDGVMPQTVEAINHAKAANVPIIVAINKMDKPAANPERVKQDLTAYELVPEEWGGDTIMVPVSAHTGEGVDTLLEMILLEADMLQLRANPNRMAKGVIIEAKLDKARGPVATVLLQNGTLHVGDNIVAGMASGRVRAMVNDRGERVTEAGPSMPVEISGFTDVPSAGDDMMAVADDHLGRQVVQERRDKLKAARAAASSKVSLDNLFSRIDQSKLTNLNIIIKADVQGSVEAVKQALEKLSNDEVKVRVLHSAVGAITKDDVNLASAFDAIIIGFNIRPDASAREAAEREGVDVRLYRVIYQAIEDVQKAMKGLLEPEYKEVTLGHAEVRNTFRITGAGTVAGCYVKDGKLQRNAEARLIRDNVVVFEGKLSSLKRFKDDAKEVAEGYECGVSFDSFNDIKEGDVIECYVMEEVER